MTQRTQRIDELLRQEIGQILAREIADPRIGFATITAVETAPDLRHARVWVSVIGQPGDRKDAVRALQRAMPFVRHELGSLRLKRIPELHVELDDTAERGTRLLRLLDDIEEGAPRDGDLPLGETLPTPLPRLPHEGDSPDAAAAEPAEGPTPPTPKRDRRRTFRPPAGRRRPPGGRR